MKLEILDNEILNIIKNRIPSFASEQCNNNYKPSNIISKVNNIKYLVFNPIGRKATIWFTYYEDELLCILNIIGTNNYFKVDNSFNKELVYNNCLIFGYIFMKNNKQIFSFDKILNYNTFYSLNNVNSNNDENLTKNFEKKLNYFNYILNKINNKDGKLLFCVPIILDLPKTKCLYKTLNSEENSKYDYSNIEKLYNIYSITIFDKIKKYNNYSLNNLEKILINSLYNNDKFSNNNITISVDNKQSNNNNNKVNRIYSKNDSSLINEAYFNVKAGNNQDEYYAIINNEFYSNLLIDTYKLSILMNSCYRNIRENQNLDMLEESDDEEEFNDESVSKFTDLDKCLIFKCKYNKKFKKWIPIDTDNYTISSLENIKYIERNA